MKPVSSVGKRDFIQHTSQYLKKAETNGMLIITHQNKAVLKLIRIEDKGIQDLRGTITFIKISGDINEPEFLEYDKW